MKDNLEEILWQSFLQEALVSSSGMGRYVRSLMLSIQPFLCWPWCHPPSKVPWRMVLERLSWSVTCPNHASFCFVTVARSDSYGPTRKLNFHENKEKGSWDRCAYLTGLLLDIYYWSLLSAGIFGKGKCSCRQLQFFHRHSSQHNQVCVPYTLFSLLVDAITCMLSVIK